MCDVHLFQGRGTGEKRLPVALAYNNVHGYTRPDEHRHVVDCAQKQAYAIDQPREEQHALAVTEQPTLAGYLVTTTT